MPRTRSLLASVLVLAGLVGGVGPVAHGALSPNQSILLYKPGKAVTGTLADGTFIKKRTLELRGWELAAASRDTLALYDRDTGRLRTGTFRRGVFTPVESKTIRTGFRRMVASCDTLLLYEPASGRALSGILTGGRLRQRHTFQLGPGWDLFTASCDTMMFEDAESPTFPMGRREWGALTGGLYTTTEFQDDSLNNVRILASTTDSVFAYDWSANCDPGPRCAFFGLLDEGQFDNGSGVAEDLAIWDLLGGNASTIIFYDRDGIEARATLKGGLYQFVGSSGSFGRGWRIIAGGR